MKPMTESTFKHKGDMYYPFLKRIKHLPRITGVTDVRVERFRPFYMRRLRRWNYIIAPKSCFFGKFINYPFRKMGGPQVSIVGTYGSGKSNLMNMFLSNYLARNINVIMFNDRRFEARNLAPHGYFDKNDVFHPFQIDCYIPYGYEFKKSNPLWNHRKNVHKIEYGSIIEVIKSMRPHRLTVVYDECFEPMGKLALWIDLMEALAEETTPSKTYIFAHHELSSLIPEIPTQDIYKLVRRAADVALNLRKDRIGMMTTSHMTSEVFYRVSQKFGYICFKTPVNRQSMYGPEKDARRLGIGGVNISKAGRWMKHQFSMYPEMEDKYRLVPSRVKLSYPSMKPIEKEDDEQIEFLPINERTKTNLVIQYLKDTKGLTWKQIGEDVGLPASTCQYRYDEVIKQMKEIYMTTTGRIHPSGHMCEEEKIS
jgi:hypothetical protein